jgi:cell division transport system permease protein
MLTSFKRILKFGWKGFWRNKNLSLQVIFIMIVSVSIITTLFFFSKLTSFLIQESEKRVDIAVYFQKDAPEEKMLNLKNELTAFSEQVESVQYVSKESAQENFIAKHKDDKYYLEALEQVGDNPFLPSLSIKAVSPQYYAFIADFLQTKAKDNLIEKISYSKDKQVIEQLFYITSSVKKAGLIGGIIVSLLAILITFNTIKLTIFSLKEEITTSRLVGASHWFIAGPFFVQGLLYALFSVLIFNALLAGIIIFLHTRLQTLFFDFNLITNIKQSFLYLFSSQILFAFLCATISCLLAVRKYLKA